MNMSDTNYIVVKQKDWSTISINDVINDSCTNLGLCVPVSPGERLPSILKKICSQIQKSNGTFLAEGDNISITGTGTQADPYVISFTGTTGGGTGSINSVSLQMPQGFIVTGSPLTDDGEIVVSTPLEGLIQAKDGAFGIVVLGEGLEYVAASNTLKVKAFYTHTQAVASAIWNIPHNLGKVVKVSVFVNNKEVFADVENVDTNNATVTFSKPQSGYALCNI